jgi:hypothetical protein
MVMVVMASGRRTPSSTWNRTVGVGSMVYSRVRVCAVLEVEMEMMTVGDV